MTTLYWTRRSLSICALIIAVAGCSSLGRNSESEGGLSDADLTADESASPVAEEAAPSGGADAQLDEELASDELSHDAPAAPPKADNSHKAEANTNTNTSTSVSSDVVVNDLKYVSKKGGSVVIETSGPASYQTREVPSQNQFVIEIANAHLPDRLKRPYITKDFHQAIASINAYQDKGSNTARVVIQFKDGHSTATVSQQGRSISVAPASASDSSGGFDNEMLGENSNSGSGAAEAGSAQASATDSRILPSSSLEKSSNEEVRFYGKPISIEVRDTPVREVINLIAEQSGANIIMSSEVEGNISMKLKQIPWDQALLLVMKSRNLGYNRQGTVLRIAPLATLQRETDEARKVLDAQQQAEPLKVRVIPVSYANVTTLAPQVKEFLSARGKVVADARTSSLIVTEIEETLTRVTNLVKALDLPPLQVLIEGKVVEAQENFGRFFGINWNARGQDVNLGGPVNLSSNIAISAPVATKALDVGIRLGTIDILGDLSAALSLYERENVVRIVSSPRIVTMNNEAASIIQSTNIPIPQTQTTATGPVTTFDYKPVELRLEVTPQITAEGSIIMQLLIRREFAGDRTTTPDINRREAKTKVLVPNGQTAVVGGIYQSDTAETNVGVPWLKEIPVIGWLFKSKSRSREKNELLLFLTPRILNSEQANTKESSL